MPEKAAKKSSLSLQTSTSWLFAERKSDAVLVAPTMKSPSSQTASAAADVATVETEASAASSDAALSPGDRAQQRFNDDEQTPEKFGDEYEVINQIGEGAVCNVYRVKSNSLKREFALKVLKDDLIANGAAIKQFKKEVNAATDLTHANIAAVYGYGHTSSGAPFVVTHLIEGKNMAQAVREEGPFEVGRALNLFVQICDAMAHAHFKSVVHRDLKPSNVVLSLDDAGKETARVIDFGMATVLQSARTAVADVTRTGEIFGSPHYMSPEQCRGEKVDERSDIYSFGCLIYEVINGTPPFAGLNLVQVIMRQLQEPAPRFDESRLGSTQMSQLQTIVQRCLEKDPANRYQHFDQLKGELDAVLAGAPVQAGNLDVQAPIKLRVVASAIDGLILAFMIYLVGCITDFTTPTEATHYFAGCCNFWLALAPEWIAVHIAWFAASCAQLVDANDFLAGVYLVLAYLYHVLFEFSFFRATPGKLITGLVVVNRRGERISLFRAIPRFFSKFLILPLLALELFWLPKRSWKNRLTRPAIDSWSGTYVIKRKNCATFGIKGPQGYFSAQTLSLEKVHRSLKKFNWLLVLLIPFTALGFFTGEWNWYALPLVASCLPFYITLQRRKQELLLNRKQDSGDSRSWWTGLLRNTLDGKTGQ